MKILLFTPIYYIEGREKLVHDSNAVHYLVKPWAAEHEVVVIYLYSQSLKTLSRYLDKDERNYYRDGYYYEKDHVKIAMCEVQRIKVRCESNYVTKRLAGFVERYLQEQHFTPDVVVSHIPTQMVRAIDALNFQCPKIAVLHQSDIKLSKERKTVVEELNRCFDTIYCRSTKIRNYFQANTNLQVSEELVCSGIPILQSWDREQILESKRKAGRPLILYTGRLIKRKHVDLIIKALSEIQDELDFYFEIIGKGPERSRLERLAKEKLKADRFAFLDYMPREDVFKKMYEASVFVMPSTEETLGLVYLEAMSQGCICIGTKGEGIDGIIENNRNGFLVAPDDIEELADSLRKALQLSEEADRNIRASALDTAKKYNDIDMAWRYLALITPA